MGTTMTRPAASAGAALYLKSSVRLRFEPLLVDVEAAAQADWATAGNGMPPAQACCEIEVALASIKLLLSRELSAELREKLEHDREVLEMAGVRQAHRGLMDRIMGLFHCRKVSMEEIQAAIDEAQADAFDRFAAIESPDLRFEVLDHIGNLNQLELDARAI